MGTGGFRGRLIGARIDYVSSFSCSLTKLCDNVDEFIFDAHCSNQEIVFREISDDIET